MKDQLPLELFFEGTPEDFATAAEAFYILQADPRLDPWGVERRSENMVDMKLVKKASKEEKRRNKLSTNSLRFYPTISLFNCSN